MNKLRIHFYQTYFWRSIPIYVFIALSFISQIRLAAQTFPPKPRQWVIDTAGILKNNEIEHLNQMLRTYEDTTSNQIVVAIFKNAQGYPVEEYSIRLAEMWKIGQKGKDNGIILAIFLEERKIRIEVGYGLEDMVPDAIAIQIAQNIISPSFRDGKYYEGINKGIISLMKAASGKFKGIPRKGKKGRGTNLPLLFFVFIIILIISSFRRRSRAIVGSRGWRSSGPFFFGGMGGGSAGGFSGGGGFSAGGGSFGGGGATGSW